MVAPSFDLLDFEQNRHIDSYNIYIYYIVGTKFHLYTQNAISV